MRNYRESIKIRKFLCQDESWAEGNKHQINNTEEWINDLDNRRMELTQ